MREELAPTGWSGGTTTLPGGTATGSGGEAVTATTTALRKKTNVELAV